MNSKLLRVIILMLLIVNTGCEEKKFSALDNLQYLPSDAFAVIQINHLANLKTEVENNDFINQLNEIKALDHFKSFLPVLDGNSIDGEILVGLYKIGEHRLEYVLTGAFDIEDITVLSEAGARVNPMSYQGQTLNQINNGRKTFYHTQFDDQSIVSSSSILLENLIRTKDKTQQHRDLLKYYGSSNRSKSAIIYFNLQEHKNIVTSKNGNSDTWQKTGKWVMVDFWSDKKSFNLSGIIQADSLQNNYINLFRGDLPSEERLSEMIPEGSESVHVYNISDFNVFVQNQQNLLEHYADPGDLFESVEKIAKYNVGDNEGVIIKLLAGENVNDYLASKSKFNTSFQGYDTRVMVDDINLVQKHFASICSDFTSKYFFWHNDCIFFGNSETIIKSTIDHLNRQRTLLANKSYVYNKEMMPNESSMFYFAQKGRVIEEVNDFLQFEGLENPSKELNDFVMSSQLSEEASLTHLHLCINTVTEDVKQQTVSPKVAITLDAEMATQPQFLINHRNKNKEIAVQDKDYNLYLIDKKGRIVLKKKLDGLIQGKIHQVDLFRNGKLQMAFCTNNRFMVLDRNGDVTKNINKKFNDGNLNPLAVFDYDKNRNYRMIVTQGKDVYMYNSEGKIVDAFRYKKANSNITQAPKHFKIGTKDYLVFTLENGTVKILQRNGMDRIVVNKKYNFSDNEVYLYKQKFSFTTKEGVLVQIGGDSKISETNLQLTGIII